MLSAAGWQEALPEIFEAGVNARLLAPFDERARKLKVEQQVLDARRFPLWPPVVGVAILLIPNGWIVTVPLFVFWGAAIAAAHRRGVAREIQLDEETRRIRSEHQHDFEQLRKLLAGACSGDVDALDRMLHRWLGLRPRAIANFEASISRTGDGVLCISGSAVRRSEILQTVPRIGRGGKTFYDKRKAGEIDEDMAELNAGAVLSMLVALFSNPTPHAVSVRIEMSSDPTTAPIPWIRLNADLDRKTIESLTPMSSAVESIRKLGGDVGSCRSQRLSPALEGSHNSSQNLPPVPPRTLSATLVKPAGRAAVVPPPSELTRASYVNGGASVEFGDAVAATVHKPTKVPPAPARISSAAPKPILVNVQGQFARTARKFADFEGLADVPFVPFQAYWATYANMNEKQLEFYFSWRATVRRGEAPPTALSYIFVPVYELLHVIGAIDAQDATRQLQSLWMAYRAQYPKLDHYLVPWTADLHAVEISSESAVAFLVYALKEGADAGADESALVTDWYWSKADFQDMPMICVSDLVDDERLGSNKFFAEYNSDHWLDRAYRDALEVTDRTFSSANGRSVREATILAGGYRRISREAFRGAVYDWKRKQAVLGKVPALDEKSSAVQLYRNAVRFAENILRKEKSFPSKLRGIAIPPDVEGALTAHFTEFARITRPKPNVIIDFAKAAQLSRDSEQVRARLLEGLADPEGVKTSPIESSHSIPAESERNESRVTDEGLLTDLEAVKSLYSSLSEPARNVLRELAKHDWELDEESTTLRTACNGALLAPLVDEINSKSLVTLPQALLVREQTMVVMQEDFRDEVFWMVQGSLQGFDRGGGLPDYEDTLVQAATGQPALADEDDVGAGGTDGFAGIELCALRVLLDGKNVGAELDALAAANATTPLLLLDRINEVGLNSAWGDLIVDCDAPTPTVLTDAESYVKELLERTGTVAHQLVQASLVTAAQ